MLCGLVLGLVPIRIGINYPPAVYFATLLCTNPCNPLTLTGTAVTTAWQWTLMISPSC